MPFPGVMYISNGSTDDSRGRTALYFISGADSMVVDNQKKLAANLLWLQNDILQVQSALIPIEYYKYPIRCIKE